MKAKLLRRKSKLFSFTFHNIKINIKYVLLWKAEGLFAPFDHLRFQLDVQTSATEKSLKIMIESEKIIYKSP